jgi:tetratricopeptide (TPR) repeat protein
MKKFLPPVLAGLMLVSCVSPPGDETLIRYARAQKAYQEGNYSETLSLLEGLRGFAPGLLLKGKGEYFSGDLEAAERSFRRARKLRPGSLEAGLYLSRILRERGDSAGAAALAESLLADDPLNVRALRLTAELAREGGRAAASQAYLDRAVEASAESAMVFLDRARARWSLGRGEEALEDLKRAQVLIPWDTPLVRSIQNLESIITEALR